MSNVPEDDGFDLDVEPERDHENAVRATELIFAQRKKREQENSSGKTPPDIGAAQP